jgi:hypothetical protein
VSFDLFLPVLRFTANAREKVGNAVKRRKLTGHGTAWLQTPYLLSLSLLVWEFMESFPAAPAATFRLLNRLDMAFASLLQGRNVETGETLPGFERGPAVSMTEKVRIKSLIERTRMRVVNVMSMGGSEMGLQGGEPTETETETETEDEYGLGRRTADEEGMDDDTDEGGPGEIDRMEMGIARVYERTMVELGGTLGGAPIGIITDY